MDVSCAYLRAYLYVSFNRYAQIKQCISVEYHLKNTCRYAHAGPLMTYPRPAARASPLRAPGLCARAGFFKLASRARTLRTRSRTSSTRRPGPSWPRLAALRDLRAVRRALGPPGPAAPPAGAWYVTRAGGDGAWTSPRSRDPPASCLTVS